MKLHKRRYPTTIKRYCACALVLCFSLLAGCTRPVLFESETYPPDFSLQVCVQAPPLPGLDERYGVAHVVQPDGMLRSATGPGCTLNTYPEPTCRLDAAQLQTLYDLTRQLDFTPSPTPPTDTSGLMKIQVLCIVNGQKAYAWFTAEPMGDWIIGRDERFANANALVHQLDIYSGLMPVPADPSLR